MDTHHDDLVLDLAERVARLDPRLPELTRQRLLVAIHARIEQEERRAGKRSYALAALALLGAASLVLALWLRPAPQVAVKSRTTPAAVAVSVEQRAAPAAPQPPAVLVPYLASGMDAPRSAALLDHEQNQIVLAAHERVLATLADRARLSLHGPAELRVISSDPTRVEIELLHGTLLGDYDHARGGTLIVRAPGMISEVVGTLFMVHAQGGAARTAVLHGAVRVQVSAGAFVLHDRQTLSAGAGAITALNADDARALRAHAASLAQPDAQRGMLGTSAEPSSPRARERAVREPVVDEAVDPSAVQEPAAPISAADLYRAAEAAMRERDQAEARTLLAQLVHLHPAAPEVDLALYELAELSLRAADDTAADAWLTQLEQFGPRPALRESVGFMRCRLLRARHDSDALSRCLAEFHARFPASTRK